MTPTAPARESVMGQLEKILSSQTFGGSGRSSRLLQFLVEETMEGRGEQLKEYTIGAQALGRGDGFDPRTDPIVRAEASRLRSRLGVYYSTEGKAAPLVIALPKGSYIPSFEAAIEDDGGLAVHPRANRQWIWQAATAALAIALVAVLAWNGRTTGPAEAPVRRFEVELRSGGSLGSTVGPDVTISHDGSRIAFVSQDSGGVAHLYMLRLDEQTPVQLAGTDGARVPFFSPDDQWIGFGDWGRLKKIPAAGGPSVDICTASNLLGASWGDDGNIIVTLEGTGRLWRVPAAGGSAKEIANIAPAIPLWPQILPGGESVLFSTYDGIEVLSLRDHTRRVVGHGGTYARYFPNGYLTYVSGGTLFGVAFDPARAETHGTPVALLDDVAYSPTFGYAQLAVSQTGTLVYRRATSLLDIEWLHATGKTEPLLAKPARYARPRLSPDGRRLAYSTAEIENANSWIYDIASKKTTRLGSTPAAVGQPMWTLDGRFLLLGGLGGMRWIGADGGELAKLNDNPAIQTPTSISPDGKRLAYLQFDPKTSLDLWTVPIAIEGDQVRAGKPEPFLTTTALEGCAMFSPDGKWIAYCSTESGSWEVYVQPFPGGRKVLISSGGGRIPIWSKNGHQLFYTTERQKILKVDYTIRNGTFEPSTPVLWTERTIADTGVIQAVDLAPDGKRFAALMPAESTDKAQSPNHVTVIINFLDEVRRKVTEKK